MMLSIKAKIALETIKSLNTKKNLNFMAPPRFRRQKLPNFLLKWYPVREGDIDGFRYFTFEGTSSRHILFLHGGGYAMEATIGHYMLIKRMMEMYSVSVTIIEYPLTPEYQAHTTLDVVSRLYKYLSAENPTHTFSLFGDSAGGGLALTLAMWIRENRLPQPERIILVSPWLDIALENEAIMDYKERDVLLDLEGVQAVGNHYRGSLSKTDYRVSPLYGDLSHLGKIALFYTSEEILKPDCVFLSERVAEGTQIKSFEFEELWHDFILWPIPERESFLELISAYMY